MPISCIIIDDEREAREGLELLLQDDQDVEIVESCSNGLEAIQAINELKPQLILLDIQMPGANGFEVLNNIAKPFPEIIFITAYDQFAIKAFDVHALDYLLKPFNDARFFEAISHAKSKIGTSNTQQDNVLKLAKEALEAQPAGESAIVKSKDKLVLKSDGKIYFVDESSIKCITAFDYYIKVHVDDSILLVRESMKSMLEKLGDDFIRIHKSSIVNLKEIKSLSPLANNEMEVTLGDGSKLKVSRSYKSELKRRIS